MPASCATAQRSKAPCARRGPGWRSWTRGRASQNCCGTSSTTSQRSTTTKHEAKCRRRVQSRARSPRSWRNAASNSAGRPSSTPSCRRSAWSTIIWSAAIATKRAKSSGCAVVVDTAQRARRAARTSTEPRAWQRMLSGRRLDLLDPSPLDIELEDIAHGLARVARWNGQTKGAHIYSVAQHCLLVEALARLRAPRLDRGGRLAVLLHDAPEYVIGDMISPFKAVIGGDYKAVELRLLTAIHRRFGLPAEASAELKSLIKTADSGAAYLEATRLAGFEPAEARRFFGRPPAVSATMERDFLKPWPAETAEARYFERIKKLASV